MSWLTGKRQGSTTSGVARANWSMYSSAMTEKGEGL